MSETSSPVGVFLATGSSSSSLPIVSLYLAMSVVFNVFSMSSILFLLTDFS